MNNMEKILILLGILAITEAYDSTRQNYDDNEPIVCDINFMQYYDMYSIISSTTAYKNDTTEYFLLDIKNYANSFEDFIKKYPSVRIITSGVAISNSTIGDVGRNKFGILNYPTYFWMDKYVNFVDIVDTSDAKWGAYYVKVAIGMGFAREDTRLFLIPYIDGVITSHGFMYRYLKFGLSVESVIFNSNPAINSTLIFPHRKIPLQLYSIDKISTA